MCLVVAWVVHQPLQMLPVMHKQRGHSGLPAHILLLIITLVLVVLVFDWVQNGPIHALARTWLPANVYAAATTAVGKVMGVVRLANPLK